MPVYSDILMDHFTFPRNVGRLEHPDVIGVAGAQGLGQFFVLHLHILDGRIVDAKYQTHGCGPTIAAGSLMTSMLKSRTLADCALITSDSLTEALGGVPPNKAHCPALAAGALHDALRQIEATHNRSEQASSSESTR